MHTHRSTDTPSTREHLRWDRIRVLMYHRIVREEGSQCPWTVKASLFRGHLELLRRLGFSTITLSEYVAASEKDQPLPPKPIILTFDDGYVDFLDVTIPILKEYEMKAVLFAVVDPPVRTNFWDRGPQDESASLLEEHHLLQVHQAGCEVGSHTLTHPRLPSLSEADAWNEIHSSRQRLEEITGSPVVSFSYPYGLLNERCKQLVIKAGYKCACAAWTGPVRFTWDRYEIRRILVCHDMTPRQLWRRVMLPYQEYRWMIWKAQTFLKRN